MIGGMGINPTAERPTIRDYRELVERRRRDVRRRERQAFGGRIQWEAVFFGLLAAVGLMASLLAMVLGGMVAAGVTDFRETAATLVDHVMTAGGYVASRMARFDGLRQGLGVWLLSVLLALAVAITAWIAGGDIDPTKSITLPSNPVDEGPLSQSGWVILAVGVVVPLVFALLGGLLGERFHRAVDRAGFDEPVVEPDEEADVDEREADTEVNSEAETAVDSDDQPYGPDRVRQDAPASAASSSEESTVSPAARP
jgi:hypothetical protein